MKRIKKLVYLSILGVLPLLSGCGAQSYQSQSPYYINSQSSSGGSSSSTGNSNSSTVPISNAATDTSTDTTGTTQNSYALITTSFQIYGNRDIASTNITPTNYRQFQITNIKTSNVIRIALSAYSPGLSTETGYQIPYNCAKFTVKVGNSTQTAFISTAGDSPTGNCQGATSNPTLNFDSAVTSGGGPYTLTITPTVYDNCNQVTNSSYGTGTFWQAGCSLNTIYNTHIISGGVTVYVNSAS